LLLLLLLLVLVVAVAVAVVLVLVVVVVVVNFFFFFHLKTPGICPTNFSLHATGLCSLDDMIRLNVSGSLGASSLESNVLLPTALKASSSASYANKENCSQKFLSVGETLGHTEDRLVVCSYRLSLDLSFRFQTTPQTTVHCH